MERARGGPGRLRRRECGAAFGSLILKQGHARLTAYAAVRLDSDALRRRAWTDFYTGDGYGPSLPWRSERLTTTLNPSDEATWVSTNTTALYGLSAIQCLALVGDSITDP
ncbi:hypothetical protein [Actinomadura sp. HBU206391]|uniref:exo-rhamnogalacturonan lyase family protein n=1 Tax=Actinomadura sp. HBU206391 TaxID=2731692 RepID=UPI00164F9EE8|nr:hypothetical protein [Actinomadura sp. HBU206391]MBC6460924.1 hypothetical protein [Actinomadura sp. HBU206391]